ncbi:hypothetical protein Plhal304r1_c038g0114061 [Plasmopara halstedii]
MSCAKPITASCFRHRSGLVTRRCSTRIEDRACAMELEELKQKRWTNGKEAVRASKMSH